MSSSNNLPTQPPPPPPHVPDGPKVPSGTRIGRCSSMSNFNRPGHPSPTPPYFPDGPRVPSGPPKGKAALHILMSKPRPGHPPPPPPNTGDGPNRPKGYRVKTELYAGVIAGSNAQDATEITSWSMLGEQDYSSMVYPKQTSLYAAQKHEPRVAMLAVMSRTVRADIFQDMYL